MHEHSFKKIRKQGNWMAAPSEKGILIAHEGYVKLCECGTQVRINTHHIGTWKKASERKIKSVLLYPLQWQNALRTLLKLKADMHSDIDYYAERVIKLTRLEWHEFEKFTGDLLKEGILELFEPYPRDSRKTKILFRSETVSELKPLLGLDAVGKEKQLITDFFEAWEYSPDVNAVSHIVAQKIDWMKDRWEENGKPIIPLSEERGSAMNFFSNYLLLLKAIRGIFNAALTGEMISLRSLSTEVAGDSKALEKVKSHLKTVLGELESFGVVEHSPFVFCRLPVIGTVGGRTLDLGACEDYISLTMRTARTFKPTASSIKKLMLVENLTSFERIAGEKGLSEKGLGIVFSFGLSSGHVREFIKSLPPPDEALIWCDLDPDGIEIALTAANWFENWRPVFMEKEYLLSSITKPLEDHDYAKLSSFEGKRKASIFSSLISEMKRLGVKVEQEAQKITDFSLYA